MTLGWILVAGGVALVGLGVPLLQAYVGLNPPRHRSTLTPEDLGLRYEDVTIRTADGLDLAAWWVPAAEPTDTALVVGHGYPVDKGDVLPAASFLQEDHHLLFVDLRSFGDSEGERTTLGLEEVEDVRAAVGYALGREEVDRVAAWGFSLSASALLRADDERLACVVAEAPFADLVSLAEDLYAGAGCAAGLLAQATALAGRVAFGVDAREVDVAGAVGPEGPPVLLIHGSLDETVPPEHSQRLAEALGERAERWVVEGAGHGGAQALQPEAYRERVRAFLDEHLAEA